MSLVMASAVPVTFLSGPHSNRHKVVRALSVVVISLKCMSSFAHLAFRALKGRVVLVVSDIK